MICELEVIDGPARGLTFSLRETESIAVGRHIDADFCCAADQHMSRKHVSIQWDTNVFRLNDLGSRNGTFINNTQVTEKVLESGDRLNIGNSIIRITIQDESDTKEMATKDSGAGLAGIPAQPRKLNLEAFPFDGESTFPLQLDKPQLDKPLGAAVPPVQAVVDSPSTLPPPSTAPAAAQAPPAAQAQTAPGDDFYAEFEAAEHDKLWIQKSAASPEQSAKLLDLLLACKLDCRFSLVVNRSQLTTSNSGPEELLSFCTERALSETLFLLQSETQADVVAFYRRCLTKDAAVLLATDGPISDVWLRTAISSLSFPSLLHGVIQKSRGRTVQLAQGARFFLFEPNMSGKFCLLRKS